MNIISGIGESGFLAHSAFSADIANKDALGRKIDETYLTAVPAGYATENWVSSQGYLTAHQSLDGLMSSTLLEISDNKITGYNGTAFAGQGGVTGDYELSAGSGISIVDYPLEQKTVISVTAQGGNTAVEQAVIDNSATWNTVSDKLDTTAFSDVSGTFLTAHQDLSDYQTIAGMTAYQEAGNYLSANALDELSGNWETVTAKLDTSAFSDVSGTFLTAHQDLSDYQTTAGMTAYQSAGDYYSASNPSGFLTGVPDTYLQNTDLTITDNKVTEISGIPLAGGGTVPEGVLVESGLEFNAVNEISGYSGSAIAQYGAEKQWLTHDDTIVHVSNSAQYAFGCNVPVVAQQMGVDETLLWSGDGSTKVSNISLSGNPSDYSKIKVLYGFNTMLATTGNKLFGSLEYVVGSSTILVLDGILRGNNTAKYEAEDSWSGVDTSAWTWIDGGIVQWGTTAIQTGNNKWCNPYRIYGIGRKENA